LYSCVVQVPSNNNNASYGLRQIYQKYLLPYEEYLARRAREAEEEAERKRAAEEDEALQAAEILEAMLGLGPAAYDLGMQTEGGQGNGSKRRKKVKASLIGLQQAYPRLA
jgi:hypothetical protein